MRDNTTRLKELLTECAALNTTDPLKQLEAATRVWSYARSIAQEIGQPFQNPPAPRVCLKAGGDCSCNNCPPETLSSTEAREVAEAYASRDPAAIQAVRKKYLKEEESC